MGWYVALLRGINVGGRNLLPMKELRSVLGELGLRGVKTYIQSGNVLFEAEDVDEHELARRISSVIESKKGFAPRVLVISSGKFQSAADANPFNGAHEEPGKLHLAFTGEAPAEPDMELLESVRAPNERFELIDGVLYLHAPDGIGRSKLASKIEQALGVPTTMRNWRTVSKLLEMAAESTS